MLYKERGNLYRLMGRIEKAIQNFNFVLKHDKNDAECYFLRSAAYAAEGSIDLAEKDAKEAQRLGYLVPDDYLQELRSLE